MAKIHVLYRVLELADGQRVQTPIGVFTTPEAVKKGVERDMGALGARMNAALLLPRPGKGPVQIGHGRDVASDLGISAVTHVSHELEQKDGVIEVPSAPKIIVPS